MKDLLPKEFRGSYSKGNQYVKTKPRNWTNEEIAWCLSMREKGHSMEEIAKATGRSRVSVSTKLKRLKKKDNTYNEEHVEEKYEGNRFFIEEIQPQTLLDLYCGESRFYTKEYPEIETITNDKNPDVKADYHMEALKLLCQFYIEGRKFDVIDLDPYGSASECFDLAMELAKKGLVVTLGEMGHKRWKRLDYVKRHYGIDSFDEFQTDTLINKIIEQGKKHKKVLTPLLVKEWKNISRVWFRIEPLKITEQWEK